MLEQDIADLRITAFDRGRADALRRIWFVGDVHGKFRYLAQTLLQAQLKPRWIVFVGDIDIFHKPFREILEPRRTFDPTLGIAFIHGNYALIPTSVGRCSTTPARRWCFTARSRGATPITGIARHHLPGRSRSPGGTTCRHLGNPRGYEVLDDLAQRLGVVSSFHGHHHDDLTAEYAQHRSRLGFDAVGLRYCQIKNGLGEDSFEAVRLVMPRLCLLDVMLSSRPDAARLCCRQIHAQVINWLSFCKMTKTSTVGLDMASRRKARVVAAQLRSTILRAHHGRA